MALISCKECGKEVYTHTESCPQCGVKEPGISYEEERIMKEIKLSQEERSRATEGFLSIGFLQSVFFPRRHKEFRRLEYEAIEVEKHLKKRLSEIRYNKACNN